LEWYGFVQLAQKLYRTEAAIIRHDWVSHICISRLNTFPFQRKGALAFRH